LLGTSSTSQETNEPQQPPVADEDEEQEFEFRLFSAPAKAKDATTKAALKETSAEDNGAGNDKQPGGTQKLRIRLRSPSPANPSDGRFVKAFRGWQYYFSTPSLYGLKDAEDREQQEERRRQFEEMAVSGEHVTTWAKSQPWVS
jgi:hypothetical protein